MTVPPFDREKAIENFGSADVLREASKVYLEEAMKQYGALVEADRADDYEQLREKAHLIKGGLVYLQATPSAMVAKKIEDLSESDGASQHKDALGELVDELDRELDRLLQALQSEQA